MPDDADQRDAAEAGALVAGASAAQGLSLSRLRFSSGRMVEAEEHPEGDRLRIRASNGEVVLTVLLTDKGPVLRFAGADLEVKAGALSLDCDRFELRAREGASIEAEEVELTARSRNVNIRANDDVDVRGERVRLNCDDPPMPLSWEEFAARHGGG